eukprot:5317086-Alexandrium_andersonii.AAC.1
MQDVLLGSILQKMDEFNVCRSPQCVFLSRTEHWVQNALMPGCPIAGPACGERYRRDRVYRGGHNITAFNKVV